MSRAISKLLNTCKTIAVVGLSPKPDRTSYAVSAYMQRHGYRIIPINPNAAGQTILGEYCYDSLCSAAEALNPQGITLELVNVFRRSEDVPPVLEDCLSLHKIQPVTGFWLQLGISHAASEQRAQAAGISVVANRCIKVELACL